MAGPGDVPPEVELPPGQNPAGRWRAYHYGRVPLLDPERWRLTIAGVTRHGAATVLDLPALRRLPGAEVTAPMHCVDGRSSPPIRWGGVPLAEILALAPPHEDARHVLLAAARGYAAAVPLAELRHPDALLATHADGEPLAPDHGWPARVVLPRLYGFKGPKWILEITYHLTPQQGWWESHGYHPRGRVDLQERWAHQD